MDKQHIDDLIEQINKLFADAGIPDDNAKVIFAENSMLKEHLNWALSAIDYALEYYITDAAAAAEVLSYINGYEGSPDIWDEWKRKGAKRDEV